MDIKTKKRVRETQAVTLEVFKAVHDLCIENSLRYFAISGTAIGAVRHKGFIPWDDDIDIAMPRKDYEQFCQLAHRLPSHLRFADYVSDSSSHLLVGRVYDETTTLVGPWAVNNPDEYTGVVVDIMPLDGVPTRVLAYRWHRWVSNMLYTLCYLSLYSSLNTQKVFYKRIIFKIFSGVARTILNPQTLKQRLINRNKRYPFDSSEYLARTWAFAAHDGMRAASRYYQSDFAEHVDVSFEDTVMRLPKGYDRYLSSLYPNYMQLPPEDKRVPGHGKGLLDLSRPYTYYAAKKQDKVIGYVPGSFDMFHVGHLNVIEKARRYCDYLIVGVNSDDLMYKNKGKRAIVPETERLKIISSISLVDDAILVDTPDKVKLHDKYAFDVLFVGSDYKGKWDDLEAKFTKRGARIHYFDYTPHTSSTKLRDALDIKISEKSVS